MKKNKFYAAVILTLIMGLFIVGCGKQEKQVSKEDTKKTEAADEKKTEEKEEEKEIPYEKGVRIDNGYESAWLNMRFILPENARLASDEEIQKLYANGAEIMDMENSQNASDVCEMVVIGGDGVTNISVAATALPISSMDEKTYLDMSLNSLIKMGSDLSYQLDGDITDEVIAGQPFKKGSVTGVYQGITMNQDIYARKIGSRMVLITVSYSGDATVKDTLLNGFQPYE